MNFKSKFNLVNLMRSDIQKIKVSLKQLNNDGKINRDQYKEIYKYCKEVKEKFSRKRKPDQARYVPIRTYAPKIRKILPNSNIQMMRKYVKNCAEIYHGLRTDFVKTLPDYNPTKHGVASSSEINLLAGYIVGFNSPNLDTICEDSTVSQYNI